MFSIKIILIFLITFAKIAGAQTVDALIKTAQVDGWSDDELVNLYHLSGNEHSSSFKDAIKKLKMPDEERPTQFFDAIASYYDSNHGGKFPLTKLNTVITGVEKNYLELLKDSQTGKGPQQELASMMRVKSWKLLQKLQLFKLEMKKQKISTWNYKKFSLPQNTEKWNQDHTIASVGDFQKSVCEASKTKPVLVKFGSTQCADCMLMEYTQGIFSMAEANKDAVETYKIWWGPNLAQEMDALRKKEGVKSSPTFAVYRKGLRYDCGYQFPDQLGGGFENCIADKNLTRNGVCGG